jgi:hypothetical protein
MMKRPADSNQPFDKWLLVETFFDKDRFSKKVAVFLVSNFCSFHTSSYRKVLAQLIR